MDFGGNFTLLGAGNKVTKIAYILFVYNILVDL